MKEKDNISSQGNNSNVKGPKLVVVILIGILLLILLGMQVFASVNGYGNVFFMVKEVVISKELHGKDEIFDDKELETNKRYIEDEDEEAEENENENAESNTIEGKFVRIYNDVDVSYTFEGNEVIVFAGDMRKGTYTIKDKKISITLTDYCDIYGENYESISPAQKSEMTIIDNDTLKDEFGTYKRYIEDEEENENIESETIQGKFARNDVDVSYTFEGNEVIVFAGDMRKGTYTIKDKKIKITLTDYCDIYGENYESISPAQKSEMTIIDNDTLKDEFGTYKRYIEDEEENENIESETIQGIFGRDDVDVSYTFEGNSVKAVAGDIRKGTYKIEGNKIYITLTDYSDIYGENHESISPAQKSEMTIIDNDTLKDEFGTYKRYIEDEE